MEAFDTRTGVVLQNYIPFKGTDPSGSYKGIAYSADGKHLVFSQDSSHVTIADIVDTKTGILHWTVPWSACRPTVPSSTAFPTAHRRRMPIPAARSILPGLPIPATSRFPADGTSAYALLWNQNAIRSPRSARTRRRRRRVRRLRGGNAPHSIVIGTAKCSTTAYVSNEGGRAATEGDFQINSAGTEIVADPVVGAAITGTVSVVDLASMTVTATIETGLHPTGMAWHGKHLLVTNTYSDTISVIDTTNNTLAWTIDLGLPIGVPGAGQPAYGAAPNSIAVDGDTAYVALYHANAIAVVNITKGAKDPVVGMIPVAYAPASVVLDKADNILIVANDKGIGARDSFETDYGVSSYNTHQDNGTVSIVPVPTSEKLASMTQKVFENNHWDLAQNIESASGGNPHAKPAAIPAKIGDPSLIKHVFGGIVRENRHL